MLVKNTLSLTEEEIRRVFDVNIISHFFVRCYHLLQAFFWAFRLFTIEPTQGQIERNIRKTEKNKNSSSDGGDLWGSSLITYHVVGDLECQPLPQMTPMAQLLKIVVYIRFIPHPN